MSYANLIREYAPTTWEYTSATEGTYAVSQNSEEFRQIEFEARAAINNNSLSIRELLRNQSIHDLGQFLIRAQLLATANTGTNYYEVRRFAKVGKNYRKTAVDYNLDPRRCGLSSVSFNKTVQSFNSQNDILLIVKVLTSTPSSTQVVPGNSLEYYIEYIVEFY